LFIVKVWFEADVISNPSSILCRLGLLNQPRSWIQREIAVISTEPELVSLVRRKENTSLAPLLPRYTFQVLPPTLTLVAWGTAPLASYTYEMGPTAPFQFSHSISSYA
jgi:hypothetical protein